MSTEEKKDLADIKPKRATRKKAADSVLEEEGTDPSLTVKVKKTRTKKAVTALDSGNESEVKPKRVYRKKSVSASEDKDASLSLESSDKSDAPVRVRKSRISKSTQAESSLDEIPNLAEKPVTSKKRGPRKSKIDSLPENLEKVDALSTENQVSQNIEIKSTKRVPRRRAPKLADVTEEVVPLSSENSSSTQSSVNEQFVRRVAHKKIVRAPRINPETGAPEMMPIEDGSQIVENKPVYNKKVRRESITKVSPSSQHVQDGQNEKETASDEISPRRFRENFNRRNDKNDRYNRRPNGHGDFRDKRDRRPNNVKGERSNRSTYQKADKKPEFQILGDPYEIDGIFELAPKGFGFLRDDSNNYDQATGGYFVSPELIRQFSLRPCQWIHALVHPTSRGIQVKDILRINDLPPEETVNLPHFEDLKAVNPTERISFETLPERFTTRVLDLIAPIARGQRGLIVAPPRSGKTVLLQHMAEALREKYHDDIHVMILLIDERPEEVTDFKRNFPGVEVFASSNDGRTKDHCRMAELCIERAKRLVESGRDVFVLMDSITRLARAYNNMATQGNGRTMSGGVDAKALEMPRRLFAAARNTREAGSLTIVATALIETNSRMDDLIFQEFKGTGNMELVLNRRIAENYVFPAVDIFKSGTRREELIFPPLWLDRISIIRRALANYRPLEAMEQLLFFLNRSANNTQLLLDIKS